MKQFVRSLYAAALASLVMTGCADDKPGAVYVGGKRKVEFHTNIDRGQSVPGSRVNGAKWEYGDELGVYMLWQGGAINNPGDIVLERYNCRFSVNPTTGVYNAYDESQAIYFPLENEGNRSFDFVTYYPYTPADTIEKYNYGIPVNITQNKPVLTAKGQSQWYSYKDIGVTIPPVDLTFEHQMARIKLNIKGGEGVRDRDLRNMRVTFKNANAKGIYNLLTNEFTGDVELVDVPFVVQKNLPTEEEIEQEIEVTGSTATLIMIPNEGAIDYRSIVFSVPQHETQTPGQGVETYDLIYEIPATAKYLKGKEHVYNVTLTRKEAKFEAPVVEDWEPGPEISVDPGHVEDMETRQFRRSMYDTNCYMWKSELRTSSSQNNMDVLRIPIKKVFSMWTYNQALVESGIEPLEEGGLMRAEIIWADNQDVTNYRLAFSDPRPTRNSTLNITYTRLPPLQQAAVPMNMLVGIKAGKQGPNGPEYEDFYRWSWHVWVVTGGASSPEFRTNVQAFDNDGVPDGAVIKPTDPGYDPENPEEQRMGSSEYLYLGVNTGATSVLQDNTSIGMYYQWGRPTPFPGMNAFTGGTHTKLYNAAGEEIDISQTQGLPAIIDGQQTDIVNVVTNPAAFVTSSTGNWIDPALNAQMWTDNQKSPWDPCPDGWRIPAYKNKYDETNLLSPWNNYRLEPGTTDPALYKVAFTDENNRKGYNFNVQDNPETEYILRWYPATGYRDGATGEIKDFGLKGYYWSSTLRQGSQSYFYFDAAEIDPNAARQATANAQPVRCVSILQTEQPS